MAHIHTLHCARVDVPATLLTLRPRACGGSHSTRFPAAFPCLYQGEQVMRRPATIHTPGPLAHLHIASKPPVAFRLGAVVDRACYQCTVRPSQGQQRLSSYCSLPGGPDPCVLTPHPRTHGPTPPLNTQDGYAVLSSDGPGEYPVVGESRAGHLDQLPVTPGTVAYITTGRDPWAYWWRPARHVPTPRALQAG